MNDAEIADYLKQKQIFTKTGKEFTIPSIKWIRYKHKIYPALDIKIIIFCMIGMFYSFK